MKKITDGLITTRHSGIYKRPAGIVMKTNKGKGGGSLKDNEVPNINLKHIKGEKNEII